MRKLIGKRFAAACALCAMFCLVFASAGVAAGAQYALALCAELIVPSLLPFFIVSILLTRLGVPQDAGRLLSPLAKKLWGVSGAGASAFLTGLCGGYPLGAKYIAELYSSGAVDKDEAERLLRFCSNSGPSFIIGAVGAGVFSSVAAGMILYFAHAAAAALTGIIFKPRNSPAPSGRAVEKQPSHEPEKFSAAFVASVNEAVLSVMSVCGFVVCFSVLSAMIDYTGAPGAAEDFFVRLTGADEKLVMAFLYGMLELGSGVGKLRGIPLDPSSLSLAAFIIGWGGVSVHFQTLAVLGSTELSARGHFVGRIMSAVISSLLAFAAGKVFLFPPVL